MLLVFLFFLFFVFFWNVAKAEMEQWGRMEINQMTETDIIREQVNITMFTKLILQLNQIEFPLPFSWYDSHQIVDGNRTPTNFETIILIDFNIIRLFDESISQGNIGWKIVLWDCTCTHNGSAAMFAATCHIKTSLNFVLKKQRAWFLQLLSLKKSRD
jgi:hypothetical protein